MENKNWSNKLIILTLCTLCLVFVVLLIGKNKSVYQEVEEVNKKIEIENREQKFEIWTINGGLEETLNEVIEEYRKIYPDIKFIIKTFKVEGYYEAILNAAATNTLPDMFYTWGDRELEELVKLNLVKELTYQVKVNNIENSIVNNALKSYTFNDRIYGFPVFGWNAVLFCNQELFEKNHLSYPTNYIEFLETVEIFKNRGITPLVISGNEAWMGSLYYMLLTLNEGSVSTSLEIAKDNIFFMRRPFIRGAELFKQLIELNPWQEGYENMSATECVYSFTRGEAAMMVNGSWASTNIDDASHSMVKGKVKVIPFPMTKIKLIDEGVAGYSDGFVLSKQSHLAGDVDVELFYLDIMRSISDKAVLEKGIGMPVFKNQYLASTDFETLKKCYYIFPKGYYHSAYDKLLPPSVVQKYNEAILEFVKGKIDVNAFRELITVKERGN